MESDARYHPDFATDHLKRGTKTVARQIRHWLNEKSNGGLLVDGDFHSGCKLFCNTFSYGYPHTVESSDPLHLIFDGGVLYDLLSMNGDAEYMGCGWAWPLEQFCNSIGYDFEPITSYCIGLRKR